MITYRVKKDGEQWRVRRDDAELEAGRFPTYQAALTRARALAEGFGPARIVAYNDDGSVRLDYEVK